MVHSSSPRQFAFDVGRPQIDTLSCDELKRA
jgi:hypothetical protein